MSFHIIIRPNRTGFTPDVKDGIMVAYYKVVARFYIQGAKYAGGSDPGEKGVCTGTLTG